MDNQSPYPSQTVQPPLEDTPVTEPSHHPSQPHVVPPVEPQVFTSHFSDTPTSQSTMVPEEPTAVPPPSDVLSQPVVRVLSPRGVEYVFMTIALFTVAFALGGVLISLVNGQFSFSVLSFPAATLVVAVPVFSMLFLRLKQSEINDPSLRFEASKRRSTQFTQIVSFVVSFFTLIGFVSLVFAKLAGEYHGSIIKLLFDTLVVLLIAGGLLVYYWRDEHQTG